jgi:pSer/pThr/pTyr-binding forkhead associated (FHA) protein
MNDSNGTFVNDEQIRQHTLSNGDQVCFGRAKLEFLINLADPIGPTSRE